MIDLNLLEGLPSRGKFHSCILSTFSFDFHYFNNQIKRQLNSKGIVNIIVLCDSGIIDSSFGKFSAGADDLMKRYSVIPIQSKGIFHPKVSVFFGKDISLMHVGSGNLTSGGMGKNYELFSTLVANSKEDDQLNLIKEGAAYLHSFLKDKKGFVQQQLDWILEYTSHFENFDASQSPKSLVKGGYEIAFLANSISKKIYGNLKARLPINEIISIKILSPFFDESGELIKRFLADFPNAILFIYVQQSRTKLPRPLLENIRIVYLDWGSTERGKKDLKSGDVRYNHSKLFVFETERGDIFVLQGSPNATAYAVGLRQVFNEEAALFFRMEANDLLSDLGLEGATRLHPDEIEKATYLPLPESVINRVTENLRITGADLLPNHLEIYLSEPLSEGVDIKFVDVGGELLATIPVETLLQKQIIQLASVQELRHSSACYLSRSDVKISNLTLIHKVSDLQRCNPSKENQKLQKILSSILAGDLNELNLMSHLTTILSESQQRVIRNRQSDFRIEKTTSTHDDLVDYESAKRRALEENESSHPLAQSKSMLDAIFALMDNRLASYDDTGADLEEEGVNETGDSSIGEDSNTIQEISYLSSKIEFENKRSKAFKFFEKYDSYLSEKLNPKDENETPVEIDNSELAFFQVILIQLVLALLKPYQYEKEIYQNQEPPVRKFLNLTKSPTEDDSFQGWAFAFIGCFFNLLWKHGFKKYDNEYNQKEQEGYKIELTTWIHFVSVLILQKPTYVQGHWVATLLANTNRLLIIFDAQRLEILIKKVQLLYAFDLNKGSGKLIQSMKKWPLGVEKIIASDVGRRQYRFIEKFGIVAVQYHSKNPNLYKPIFTGLEYDEDENEYFYHSYFDIQNQKFIKIKGDF